MDFDKIDAPAPIAQLAGNRSISNLMLLIWQLRKDLQQAFDLNTEAGQMNLINWFDVSYEREYGISHISTNEGAQDCTAPKETHPLMVQSQVFRLGLRLSRTSSFLPGTIRKNFRSIMLQSLKNVARASASLASVGTAPFISQAQGHRVDRGVNLIGYAYAELGMGQHLRMSATAFAKTRIKHGVVNFHIGCSSRKQAQLYHGPLISSNDYKVNLFHINADQMHTALCHFGRDFFKHRYNIGYWLWELSKCPDEWLPVMGLVNEIWAPSRFIQQTFAERSSLPVVYMPLCVTLPPLKGYRRIYYGLPADCYLFLFSFDFFSFIDRKNPFAVIDAFKRAFPDSTGKVGLVIKIMNGDPGHPRWKDMTDLIGDDPRVYIFNKVMTHDEFLGLIDNCDCFASLHRSEGFGFGPAEAMYLGKPVIVTNYSGNTDFTLPGNSCPVDYRLIPVIDGQYVFDRGQVWADPDIEHAVWYMRKLVLDNSYGKELGRKAASFIRKNHSPSRIGSLYKKRFRELNLA